MCQCVCVHVHIYAPWLPIYLPPQDEPSTTTTATVNAPPAPQHTVRSGAV